MPAPLLALKDIGLTFGGTHLLLGAELSVSPGDRIALVGRNGSGKSTLLKIADGQIEPDSGERFFEPGATIRYLPQEPDLSGFGTVGAYVEAGLMPGDDAYRAQYLLGHLGLAGHEDPRNLSGGEARRAALARVLAPKPDILLLDEPTNHLDLPAIEWLEAELSAMKSALVIISHDRRFLAGLTKATVWLDRGTTRRMDQGFSSFETWRDKLIEEEELTAHKLDRQIAREEHWVRYGVTARRKRNVRRMAELAGLRQQKCDRRKQAGNVAISISEAGNSGAMVIDAEAVSKSYNGRPVVSGFSTRIMRGDRVGVVGANGAGKTTLINLLTGALSPDAGTVRPGANVQMAHLDQRRMTLDPETTLRNALTGGGSDWVEINGQRRHFAAYMKDFLFTPEQAGTPVGRLSGGERARVALARALALPSNLLVLDEPTNDLDLETLDLLQETVADYPGTVIVVSHDRDFLDRVATSIIASDGEGRWLEYAGGYSDMIAQRGEGVTARTGEPKKAKAPAGEREAQKAAPKKKLSFHQQHALKTLPGKIGDLGERIARAQKQLDDPDFYARDPSGFAKTSDDLAKWQSELGAAETEWLELELLREELES